MSQDREFLSVLSSGVYSANGCRLALVMLRVDAAVAAGVGDGIHGAGDALM